MSASWKYISLVFLFLFPAQLFSAELLPKETSSKYSDFYYFVTFSMGTEFGDIRELVFESDVNGKQKILSELQWQHLFSTYIEVTSNFRYKKIFFDLKLRTAIPSRVGEIYNSDYLIPNSTEKTNFSMHENYLDKNISFGFIGKVPFYLHNRWIIAPSVGLSVENKKWSAMHGYKQYSPINDLQEIGDDTPKVPLYGNIISYDQLIIYPLIGVENQIEISKNLILNLGTTIYPYIYINAVDNHYLRDREFKDRMHGVFGIKTTVETTVFPFKNNQDVGLKFSTSYEKYHTKGDTTVSQIGELAGSNILGFYQNEAGATNAFFTMSMGVSFYPNRQ